MAESISATPSLKISQWVYWPVPSSLKTVNGKPMRPMLMQARVIGFDDEMVSLLCEHNVIFRRRNIVYTTEEEAVNGEVGESIWY